MEIVTDILFSVSKITADGDCSHQIRRRLLSWQESDDKLRHCVENRDIILPTKVRIVKAKVFPVVTWGCESLTIKKAEHKELMPSNCGAGEDF